jgi:hypothetical protein
MSADHSDHAEHAPAHAFDSPEEVAHAKEHAKENIYWFLGFFSIVLVAVINYEFYGTSNIGIILALAAARSFLIACFMFYLFHTFSLIFRTFLFSLVFLIGMIFLSWWDSTLPHIGDPIAIRGNPPQTNNGLTSVTNPNVP